MLLLKNIKLIKGLVILIGILALFYYAGYLLYQNGLGNPLPSESQREFTRMIPRYPNASNWKMVEKRGRVWICVDNCKNPSVRIKFTTTDSLETITRYYNDKLPALGWDIMPREIELNRCYKKKSSGWTACLMPEYDKESIIPNHYLF